MPVVHTSNVSNESDSADVGSLDIGFYEDGTRRTLTDDQIAMFRHSEIQRLLAERRRQKEAEEERATKKERRKAVNTLAKYTDSKPSRFDNDATVHIRGQVDELSYDENVQQQDLKQGKKFLWPVLGP